MTDYAGIIDALDDAKTCLSRAGRAGTVEASLHGPGRERALLLDVSADSLEMAERCERLMRTLEERQ